MGASQTGKLDFSNLQKATAKPVGLTGIRPSPSTSAPAGATPSAPIQQYAARQAQEDVMRRRQQEEQMRGRQQEEQMRRRSPFFR